MGDCNRNRICEGNSTGSPPNCITRNNGSPTLRFEDDKVEDDGEVCCVGRPRPFDRLRDLRVRGDRCDRGFAQSS